VARFLTLSITRVNRTILFALFNHVYQFIKVKISTSFHLKVKRNTGFSFGLFIQNGSSQKESFKLSIGESEHAFLQSIHSF